MGPGHDVSWLLRRVAAFAETDEDAPPRWTGRLSCAIQILAATTWKPLSDMHCGFSGDFLKRTILVMQL
jgi:hypothetical protein